jgi:hypothetical protein
MPTLTHPEIATPNFDKLESGKVVLGVPLLDGVIQVNNFQSEEVEESKLIVVKAFGSALIALEDARPIQVERVHDSAPGQEPGRDRVFRSPVEQLKLIQAKNAEDETLWIPILDRDLEIENREAFDYFLNKLGEFGLIKQARSA